MFFRLVFSGYCLVGFVLFGFFFPTETYSLFPFSSQSLPVFVLSTGDQAVQTSINLTLVLMSFPYFTPSTSPTLLQHPLQKILLS